MPEKPSAKLAIWEERLIREWRVLQGVLTPAPAKLNGNRSGTPANLRTANQSTKGRGLDSQGHGPLSRHELEKAAADLLALQRGLTGERALIGSAYMDEARRLGAYLLFYWFISYAQTQGILDMAYQALSIGTGTGSFSITPTIFQAGKPTSGDPFRILDLGSGPAPCSLAAADWLRFRGISPDKIEITACDQSPMALKSAQALAQGAGYSMKILSSWKAGISATPEGTYHVITIGHMLNELWKEDPERILKREAFITELGNHLEPGGMLIILEPALLVTGRDLLALRDRLVTSGWRVLAPCFTQRSCPALTEPHQTCHSDFSWTLPRTVRELAKKTGLDKDLVKTTALGLSCPSRQPEDHPGTLNVVNPVSAAEEAGAVGGDTAQRGPYRIVSEPMLNKAGRTRLILCGEEGRIPFSAKLGEGLPAETQFRTLRRSDAILIYQPVRRETGLALGEQTRIIRLQKSVTFNL